MMTFDEMQRFIRIQERLRDCTFHELRKDGHHKSAEGALTLSFHLPPVVDNDREPYYSVEAYSYILCPDARSKTWFGKTPAEAISKAEDAVKGWCFQSEMEMFAGNFDLMPNDDSDPELPE